MTNAMIGLHHITAIASEAQANADFAIHGLRQRLIKKTVNFDDPGTYHLYYGDQGGGTPGTILTYFPFPGAARGRPGPGAASAFAYAATDLEAVLAVPGLTPVDRGERFGEPFVAVHDPDGLQIEFVEASVEDPINGTDDGFHSVTLWSAAPEATKRFLTEIFGYFAAGSETEGAGVRARFRSPLSARAGIVDVLSCPSDEGAEMGAGTIHHVAFRARTDAEQAAWRERVMAAGIGVTPVIDRQYFNAIYFREPGGTLFEIATDPPGFTVDEPVATLGTELKLPSRYEADREMITRHLPPLAA